MMKRTIARRLFCILLSVLFCLPSALSAAEKAGQIINAAEDIPKSFVVCRDGEKTGVYLSQMAAATLLRRAESGDL